jgi:hypothetical protein
VEKFCFVFTGEGGGGRDGKDCRCHTSCYIRA